MINAGQPEATMLVGEEYLLNPDHVYSPEGMPVDDTLDELKAIEQDHLKYNP